MKCPYYDDWDYCCKEGGDLCPEDENNPESCEVYWDIKKVEGKR